MKNIFLIISVLCLLFSCDKEKLEGVPTCLHNDILEQENPHQAIGVVSTQEIDGTLYYKVEVVEKALDQGDVIITEDCTVICCINGECPDCELDYDRDEWDVIWSK